MNSRSVCLWVGLVLGSGVAVAQQPVKGNVPRTVRVYVLVTTASGEPVTDLNERDFSIWDNNVVQKRIMSFRPARAPQSGSVQVVHVNGGAKIVSLDPASVYELTFDAAVGKAPNEYHSLGIKVDRPNLNVVARQGYYAQP